MISNIYYNKEIMLLTYISVAGEIHCAINGAKNVNYSNHYYYFFLFLHCDFIVNILQLQFLKAVPEVFTRVEPKKSYNQHHLKSNYCGGKFFPRVETDDASYFMVAVQVGSLSLQMLQSD